jgi:hypothetical protein
MRVQPDGLALPEPIRQALEIERFIPFNNLFLF